MANKILTVFGTPIVWADTTDYAGDGGTRTHQITLANLPSTDVRQGAKADMSTGGVTGKIARRFAVTLRVEFDVAPADNETVDLYWASSLSITPATANPGGTSGGDAVYTGTAGSTVNESLLQLQFIGSLMCTNDLAPVVQQQTFEVQIPLRYGMPVLHNNTGEDFEGDDIEMSITFTPLEDEIQ